MPCTCLPSDPSPALAARKRAGVGLLVEFAGPGPVGVRAMVRALEVNAGCELLIVSRVGFTEGARAVAAAWPRVRLYTRSPG